MALSKAITNQIGVTTSYHKIRGINLRKVLSTYHNRETEETITTESYTLDVQVLSYVTEEIREESESYAADRRQFNLSATIEEGDTVPAFKLAYDKLKKLDVFKDAEDC